jgi:hypothetical protein
VRVLVNEAAAVVKVGVVEVVRTLGRMKARVEEVRAKATVDGRRARRQVAMRKRTIAFFSLFCNKYGGGRTKVSKRM